MAISFVRADQPRKQFRLFRIQLNCAKRVGYGQCRDRRLRRHGCHLPAFGAAAAFLALSRAACTAGSSNATVTPIAAGLALKPGYVFRVSSSRPLSVRRTMVTLGRRCWLIERWLGN